MSGIVFFAPLQVHNRVSVTFSIFFFSFKTFKCNDRKKFYSLYSNGALNVNRNSLLTADVRLYRAV
jgi:hypothetical protein